MIKIDFTCGTNLKHAIRSARSVAAENNERVEFIFNEVLVRVNPDTDVHALYMDYWRACIQKPRFSSIGPETKTQYGHKVVVAVYGMVEEVKTFINEVQRSSWIEGARRGAAFYGGSPGLYHEGDLPEEKNMRDNVWLLLLSPAESEEST